MRNADELHDALLNLVTIDDLEAGPWSAWLTELVAAARAARISLSSGHELWFAAEKWPIVHAAYPTATPEPLIALPEHLQQEVSASEAWTTLARGRVEHSGPTTAAALADFLELDAGAISAALEALEGQGLVLRGRFTTDAQQQLDRPADEWCDRRLLARIHRLTLAGLRRQIRPVEPRSFLHFLAGHHHLLDGSRWGGPVGAREAIAQLQVSSCRPGLGSSGCWGSRGRVRSGLAR